jgi:hypothetical protein
MATGVTEGTFMAAVTTLQALTGYVQADIVCNQSPTAVRLQLRTNGGPQMDAFMPVLIALVFIVFAALAGAAAPVSGYDSRDGFDLRDR